MTAKGYLLACVSAAAYGLNPFFAVPLLREGMELGDLLLYRFIVATALIAVFLLAVRESFRVTRRELATLAALGVIFAASSQCLFYGFKHMPAGIASTVLFVYPIFVALIMGFYFKERVSWVMWASLGIAFFGVAMLNLGENGFSDANLPGLGAVLVSAFFYALYMIIVNKSSVAAMPGPKLTFYALGFCALTFLARSLAVGPAPTPPPASTILWLVVFALVTTVISCITMVYAVQFIGSTPTAIMGALEPVVGVMVGVFWLDERFTVAMAVGIVLIIGAVIMVILSDAIQRFAASVKGIWPTRK